MTPAEQAAFRTVLALMMAPAIGLGIARFAYALILPDMQASLGWSYTMGGWMNTANALGYLGGAWAAPLVIRRTDAMRSTVAGTLMAIVGIVLAGLSANEAIMTVARVTAGIGGAIAFIAGGSLAMAAAEAWAGRRSFLLGLFYVGPGLGILVTGVSIPALLAWLGPGSWWIGWLALGVIASLLAIPLIARSRQRFGSRMAGAGLPAPLRPMLPILLAYAVFGAGYIGYMTFMIAWSRQAGGGIAAESAFWGAIGIAAASFPWTWSWLLDRFSGGRSMAALVLVTAVGAVLPLAIQNTFGLLLSAAVFGSAFFAVVAATTVFVRRNMPGAAWPSGIAAMTVAFSLGQVLGPTAIGGVSDIAGTLDAGLWISAGVLGASGMLALLQSDLPDPAGHSRGSA